MWRACCAAIEACGAEPDARAEMIAGAQRTFAAFEAWFGHAPMPDAQPIAASSAFPP
jgi:heme oxygenase